MNEGSEPIYNGYFNQRGEWTLKGDEATRRPIKGQLLHPWRQPTVMSSRYEVTIDPPIVVKSLKWSPVGKEMHLSAFGTAATVSG